MLETRFLPLSFPTIGKALPGRKVGFTIDGEDWPTRVRELRSLNQMTRRMTRVEASGPSKVGGVDRLTEDGSSDHGGHFSSPVP